MPPAGDGTYLNTIERCGREIRYLRISSGPQRDKYVHQLVAEAKIGRPLSETEEVDHIDGNTLNNAPDNIQVLHIVEHGRKTRRQHYDRKLAAEDEARWVAEAEENEASA